MSTVSGNYVSPIGTISFTLDDGALAELRFDDSASAQGGVQETGRDSASSRVVARLDAYFAGAAAALDDLVVAAPRGTPFQRRVWSALRSIKAGETCSYRDIAEAIGAPSAVRAVGLANSKNPIALVVPCHRVIGKNGAVTGYAAGLERKAWLLAHEKRAVRSEARGATAPK